MVEVVVVQESGRQVRPELGEERFVSRCVRRGGENTVVDDVFLPDAGDVLAVEPRTVVAQDLCPPRLVCRGVGSVVDLDALVGACGCCR